MSNPFIKVTWEDVPENFTPEKIRRVKSYFEKKYNAKSVQVITKNLTNVQNTRLQSLEATDNILDPVHQKTLMRDFITDNSINVKWELVERLDNKVNLKIAEANKNHVRYNRWFIKKVEFSNFLSFGDDNVINFTELEGITVIESTPKNFGGKSTSSVDLLMFLFFNTTTKTKTNAEIFNKFRDKNEVTVKGEIVIDDEEYIIERKIFRKLSKSGEYTVTNKLEFYKKNEDGTIDNLTGEQRRETETFIASAIGTEEDFLSTILTTGYNLEELIESKPTARGQILTKFMGLESLKIKEEIAKEIYNDWSKKLISNTFNKVQLENEISDSKESITNSENEILNLTKDLSDAEEKLKGLEKEKEDNLSARNNDVDRELINTNPTLLKREIDDLVILRNRSQKNADDVSVIEPIEYFDEAEYDNIIKEIDGIDTQIRLANFEIGQNEKLIKGYEEGKVCSACNRPLEGIDHTEEIENLKNKIKEFQSDIDNLNEQLKNLRQSKLSKDELKTMFDTYERNKLRKERYELEVEQKQLEIDTKQGRLDRYEENKKKLEENQRIDALVIKLRTQIETANAEIKSCNANIEKHNNNINNMSTKITNNEDLIKKIEQEDELNVVFKIYLTIYGKNGISKVIMKNMIPLLNYELYRLLVDSCHFILELNVNEKNEVEFLMIDTETRVVKPLNAGSGYERTISSLALRSVLTKISSLPKPNIVVMDEVFGKVADENLEMVGEFFKKIKTYFEHIFVISHNSLIRNWSDNIIMVKKEENVSSIDFITTKIS